MYLYWKLVPGAKLIVTVHLGLELVYPEADKATALAVFQLPRAGMLPTMRMVSPYAVVFCSLKVTAMAVGVAQEPPVVVLEGEPGLPQLVFVAAAQGPVAEPLEQELGNLAWGEMLAMYYILC